MSVRTRNSIIRIKNEHPDIADALQSILDDIDGHTQRLDNLFIPSSEVVSLNFVATDFVAVAPMTWNVVIGNFVAFNYHLAKDKDVNLLTVSWEIDNSVLAGAPSNEINVLIPSRFRLDAKVLGSAFGSFFGNYMYIDPGAPIAFVTGQCVVTGANSYIRCFKETGGNYTLGAGFYVRGNITLPVTL
jgi:hypothetical protein